MKEYDTELRLNEYTFPVAKVVSVKFVPHSLLANKTILCINSWSLDKGTVVVCWILETSGVEYRYYNRVVLWVK